MGRRPDAIAVQSRNHCPATESVDFGELMGNEAPPVSRFTEHHCSYEILYPDSPERQLLLACATSVVKPSRVRELVQKRLDWQLILGYAETYTIAPLLYSNLKKLSLDQEIEPEVREKLRSLYRQSHAAGINQFMKMKEILAAFSQEKIAVVLLKGAALGLTVYRSFGLRPMLDLDLLVRTNDLERAEKVLSRLGYVVDEAYQTAQWYRNHHHHLAPYTAGDGTVVVELHHDIVPLRAEVNIPENVLWDRARTVEVPPETALLLGPEDLLQCVCAHVALSQCFDRTLRDIIDITEVVRVYGAAIDWDSLVRNATGYQAIRALYYCLWIADSIAQAAIAPDILKSLKRGAHVTWLQDLCLKFLIRRAVFPDFTHAPNWVICGLINGILYPNRRGELAKLLWKRVSKRFASYLSSKQPDESVALL